MRERRERSDTPDSGEGRARKRMRVAAPEAAVGSAVATTGAPAKTEFRESMSVDETNALRASLGLAPLHATPPPPPPDGFKGSLSLSVDDTNALRLKLGLKPLHAEADKPDTAAKVGPGEFNEVLTVDATNELRASLGLRPLHEAEERTASDEIFDPKAVDSSVDTFTKGLKLDARIGTGHVRASGQWDDEYLAHRSGTAPTAQISARTERLLLGKDHIHTANFKGWQWNTHLSISATNTLRKQIGLRPLHQL